MSFKCRKCGTELPDEAAYCTSCGEKQDRESIISKLTNWATFKPKQVIGAFAALLVVGASVLTVSNAQSAASVTDSKTAANQEEEVWIAEDSDVYHSDPDCSDMEDPEQITLEQAEKDGYKPCKKCH